MSEPITITATTNAWLTSWRQPMDLMAALERGDSGDAVDMIQFARGDHMGKCENAWTLVGEAEITVHLVPRDEQARKCVEVLNAKLAELRTKYHEQQQAILAQISKLQAITFDAEAA